MAKKKEDETEKLVEEPKGEPELVEPELEEELEEEPEDESESDPDTRRKMLSLFLIFFPSILIALAQTGLYWMVYKGLLLFYQLIALKAFIDTYYR